MLSSNKYLIRNWINWLQSATLRAAAAVCVALLLGAGTARADSTCMGQVVQAGVKHPVDGAVITLDEVPADGTPEFTVMSDILGMFTLENIPPGDYVLTINRRPFTELQQQVSLADGDVNKGRFELILPATVTEFFDLFVQVNDVFSAIPLDNATVTISYWETDEDGLGPADVVRVLTSDANGHINSTGWEAGHYRFEITRANWENAVFPDIGVPDKGATEITSSQVLAAKLKPFHQTITVNVTGPDPTEDLDGQGKAPTGPLKGMLVEVTGRMPGTDKEVVPAQQYTTQEDGVATFPNLPSIEWDVTVKRMGYVPFTRRIIPKADGSFEEVDAVLAFTNTVLRIPLDCVYTDKTLLEGADARIVGLRDSNTAGIDRVVEATIEDGQAVVVVDQILPGFFSLTIDHVEDAGPYEDPNSVMFQFGIEDNEFEIRFAARQLCAEPQNDRTVTLDVVTLEPIRSIVRGRLLKHDRLFDPVALLADSHSFRFSDSDRVIEPLEHDGIQFEIHDRIKHLLPEEHHVVTTSSGGDGGYTVALLPGMYGVKAPSLTDYSGHNVEISNRKTGTAARSLQWPYANTWPHDNVESGHHRGALGFSSQDEFGLDLFLHRHFVHLAVAVKPDPEDPFKSLILAGPPENPVTVAYNDLLDGGRGILTGPVNRDVPILSFRQFSNDYVLLQDLTPGTYSLTATHARNNFNTVDFTIAEWQPPGIVPETHPFSKQHFFPGIQHHLVFVDPEGELQADYKHDGKMEIAVSDTFLNDVHCVDTDNGGQVCCNVLECRDTGSPAAPDFFFSKELNAYFEYTSTTAIPPGEYTVYSDFGEVDGGFFVGTATGSKVYPDTAFSAILVPDQALLTSRPQCAGSTVCTSNLAGAAANLDATYNVLTRAVNIADPSMPVSPTVTLELADGSNLVVQEAAQTFNGLPTAVGATHSQNKWIYRSAETRLVDLTSKTIQVTAMMERAMSITGTITATVKDEANNDVTITIPQANVEVRRRSGAKILRSTTTDSNGTFTLNGFPVQPVFLEVDAPGYYKFRKRLAIGSDEEPDLTENVELTPLPKPVIASISLDRYGLFLPGVSKTGNSDASALGRTGTQLELTWKAQATDGGELTDNRPVYDGAETPVDPVTFVDPIDAVYLVDPRWFSEPAYNTDDGDLAADAPDRLDLPDPLVYQDLKPLLDEIEKGRPDGQKIARIFSRRSETPNSGSPTEYGGKLNVFDLHSGQFIPLVIAVSERGAVAVRDYRDDLPGDKIFLQGLRMPTWLVGFLNLLGSELDGVSPTSRTTDFIAGLVPQGKMLPLPTYSLDITETDGYIQYKYNIGVSLLEGTKAPGEGALANGNPSLGISVSGEVGIKIQGQGPITLKGELKLDKDVADALGLKKPNKVKSLTSPISLDELSARGKGRMEITHNIINPVAQTDPDLQAITEIQNAVPEFALTRTTEATMKAVVGVDITPPIKRGLAILPPQFVTVILAGVLEVVRAKIRLVTSHGFGGQLKTRFTTAFPPPVASVGSTTTVSQNARQNFLGGVGETPVQNEQNPTREFRLFYEAGLGLTVAAFGGHARGGGMILIGAPRGSSDPGVAITPNLTEKGVPFVKVEGMIKGTIDWKVDLVLVSYGKDYQFDLYPFVLEFGTEEMLELIPLNTTRIRIDPAALPPCDFIGGDDTRVVDDLAGVSRLDVTESGTPAMVFTDPDPDSDGMRILVSVFGAQGWGQPGTVTAGTGIIDAAISANPAGGWIVVWTEVDANQIGNPFAAARVRYSISTDGTAWSPPTTIPGFEADDLNEFAILPQLAVSGDRVIVTLASSQSAVNAADVSLLSAVYSSATDQWSALSALPRTAIARFALAAETDAVTPQAILAVTDSDGTLEIREWNVSDADWSAPIALAPVAGDEQNTAALESLAAAFAADGTAVVAYEPAGGGIRLFHRPPGGDWTALGGVVGDGDISGLTLTPVGASNYFLAWTVAVNRDDPAAAVDPKTELLHAVVAANGSLAKPPTPSGSTDDGIHSRLQVRPDGDDGVVLTAVVDDGSFSIQQLRYDVTTQAVTPPDVNADGEEIVNHSVGSDVTLSVDVTGSTADVAIQWYKDFVPIAGATAPILQITDLQEADSGVYQVIARNAGGESASQLISLGVATDYLIALAPGWNLISFPMETPMSAADLFSDNTGTPLIAGPIWLWDPVGGRFQAHAVDEPMPAFRGAYVFSPDGGETRPFAGEPTGLPTPSGPGWHLIGPPATGPVPDTFKAHRRIFGLKNGKLVATSARSGRALKLLRGFWVYHKE